MPCVIVRSLIATGTPKQRRKLARRDNARVAARASASADSRASVTIAFTCGLTRSTCATIACIASRATSSTPGTAESAPWPRRSTDRAWGKSSVVGFCERSNQPSAVSGQLSETAPDTSSVAASACCSCLAAPAWLAARHSALGTRHSAFGTSCPSVECRRPKPATPPPPHGRTVS